MSMRFVGSRLVAARASARMTAVVNLPNPEPANDDGKCRCMCLDCRVDLHVLCDNGTCADDWWQRYFR